MSANANLVELVSNLDLEELETAMNLLNERRFKKEEARQQCKEQFYNFTKECPDALIDIEHYIKLTDTIGNFQQDFFTKLMFLGDIYSDDEKVLAAIRKLRGLYNGYCLGMGIANPGLNSFPYDENLANDVQRFLHSFEVFKPHVHRKIARTKGGEACDVTIIFLGDEDSSLSVEDQNKSKEQNIPVFIKRPGGWHVYGNVKGEWRERALDNLSAEENKALNRDPFTSQEIARIEVNKSKFPMELKPRLRKVHTFSTQITRHQSEIFIERVLNDLKTRDTTLAAPSKEEEPELELIDQTILCQVNSLIKKLKDVVENDTLSFVDKLDMIYGLYTGYQKELQPHIRAFLYPDNEPSIEKLRIDVEGELHKTLGAYIRGRVAPEDKGHFTDEFIQQRLIASHLKLCVFYINSEVEKSLKERFPDGYRQIIQFALFQTIETSKNRESEEFLKEIDSHFTKLQMIERTGSTLEQESPSLLQEVNDLLLAVKDHSLGEHRKLYRKMRDLKGEDITVLEEKIRCLQQIMDEAQVQFQPLVQRRKNIEARWAEIQNLSQTKEALQELQIHINPVSLKESPPVKKSQKKGILGFFPPLKKEDNTKNHARSVPLVSTHTSADSAKKAASLPVSVPKQSGAIESAKKPPTTPSISTSSSTVVVTPPPGLVTPPPGLVTPPPGLGANSTPVVTPPPGLLATPTTPNTMLISRHGLRITPPASSNLEPLGALGRNPIINETPIDPDADIINANPMDRDNANRIDIEADTVSESVDSDSDIISENLSNRGMRPS